MKQYILFIQGGGEGGYEADRMLVASLQKVLGEEYVVDYPELQSDESAPDFGWIKQIDKSVNNNKSDIILAGHSLGASMILKYLSEKYTCKKLKAVFLIATPYWSGDEDWKQGLKLQENFVDKLPDQVPIIFYQCRDDEEVPFSQFLEYKKRVKRATFVEIETGGHLLDNNLTKVANDIKSLIGTPGRRDNKE